MKTIQIIIKYLYLFCYGTFLAMFFTTIVNIAIKFAQAEVGNEFQFLYYFSSILVAMQVYEKTHKYLID